MVKNKDSSVVNFWKKYFDRKVIVGKDLAEKVAYGDLESFLQCYKVVESLFKFIRNDKYTQIKTVLDLGCGIGNYFNLIKSIFPNARIIGADISTNALKVAKLNYVTLNNIIDFICSSSHRIPLKSRSVSLVLCVEVLQYLANAIYEDTLKEIGRIVENGGYLLISTLTDRYLLYKTGIIKQPTYIYPRSKDLLKRDLNNIGFTVVYDINLPGTVRFTKLIHKILGWVDLKPPEMLSYRYILLAKKIKD